jgi:hypothetical protein
MNLRLAAGAAVLAVTCLATPARADDRVPDRTDAAAPPPRATPNAVAVTTEPPVASARTVWPWVLMGTGVALIATALVLEINAVREDDKAEAANVKLSDYVQQPATNPDKQRLQAEVDDHKSSASTERTVALVVGTAGFLTVAGSVVLWFYEGGKSAPAAAGKAAAFRPAFSPTFAGASLGGSF